MAFNDAFGNFGHYAFSSKPTHGRSIYESMRDGMGDAYNTSFTGLEQARLYATAMLLAHVQYQLDRAYNNSLPAKSTELLAKLEEDFQVVPGAQATLQQRRAYLSALVKISQGNSQSVISGALAMLLGSDFISYTHLASSTWPPSPGTVGVFAGSGAQLKQFTLLSPISFRNTPIAVPYSLNADSDAPVAGETYCIDPDPRRATEQITLIASSPTTITAIFQNAHEIGTVATRPYPLWISSARHSLITVSAFAANDPESRRLIGELMARSVRGVSTWSIVSAGVFTPDISGLDLPDSVGLG